MSGSPRRRVAVFADSIAFGGAERAMLTLLEHLDRTRWSPVLITHGDPGIDELRRQAAAAGVPELVVARMDDGALGARRSLQFARTLRRERFEVFHAHLRWPLMCKFALAAGSMARVPALLATVHCVDPDVTMTRSTAIQQWILGRRVGRHIAVSRYAQEKLARQLPWPTQRTVVIYNGVQPQGADARDPDLRAALAGPQSLPVVLAASNLHAIKGVDVLVEAAARVPGARFAIAGTGPEHDALARRIAELHLEERVTLLGWRADVGALLRAADLFVLPSRNDALSLAALESLAAGTPVVSTRVGGLAEAIEDGVNGVLVPPEDPGALAGAISSLLADPARRERLASAARRRAAEQFSIDGMTRRVESLYTALLAGGGTPERGAPS